MAEIIKKPKIEISEELRSSLKTQIHEQGQVVLHFLLNNHGMQESAIRIWPSSYLFDLDGNHRSELVHVNNISKYPVWQLVEANSSHIFTLIFSGLPKTCTRFQFREICDNQAGAWCVESIARNKTDVYFLRI